MSIAKWCDFGAHCFSASAENAQTLSITRHVKNQWGGVQPTTIEQDVCPECAARMGLIDDYTAPDSPAVRHSRMIEDVGNRINER